VISNPKNSTELARLDVNDPLGFCEARASKGKPELFKFDSVGDHVAGTVTEIEVVAGTYGPYREISVIRRDGTECRFETFGAVLNPRFEKANVGDAVGVRRVEDGYSAEHKKSYPLYEVTIVPGELAPRGALAASPTSVRRPELRRSPEVAKLLEDPPGYGPDDVEDDDEF
jgi:hypothetical protein